MSGIEQEIGRGRKTERQCGEVFMTEKKGDYLRNFCEAEALASSTCLDIVLTTMNMPKAITVRFVRLTFLYLSQTVALIVKLHCME